MAERRRVFPPVVHVGMPGAEEACFAPDGHDLDQALRTDVVEALAGVSGLYRVAQDGTATRVLTAGSAVGLAFDPAGGLVVVSSDTAYRFDLPLRPLQL